MTDIPKHELPFLEPYIETGAEVLEFGDKRNPSGLYRDWYETKGCIYTSMDINGRNGVVQQDVRKPFDIGQFDIVTNWGFSEHVSVQKPFWENAARACRVGGVMVGTLPKPNHWPNHAWSYWHPYEEFYWQWAEANGFIVLQLEDCGPGDPIKRMWGFAMMKEEERPHEWRFDSLFWRNPNWEIPKDDKVFYGAA